MRTKRIPMVRSIQPHADRWAQARAVLAKKQKIEVVDDSVLSDLTGRSDASFTLPPDSLGKLIHAPHEFFYLGNEREEPCYISVPKLFGKVVALPCKENNNNVQIEWVSLERDGPSTDIPPELVPHLCPYFGAAKYGAYIHRMIIREIERETVFTCASDFTDFDDEGYPVRTHSSSNTGRNPFNLVSQSPSSSSGNSDSDSDDNASRTHSY